jgi:hypothetical protein
MTNSLRRLHKKRLKREKKLLNLKKNPLNTREQHVEKTQEERKEYANSMLSTGAPQGTNLISDKKNESESVEMIGEAREEFKGKTDETIAENKDSFDEGEQNKKKKPKISAWKHFQNRWHRKWADGLIDLIFSIVASIIMLVIGYFVITNDVRNLRKDLEDPNSDIRRKMSVGNTTQFYGKALDNNFLSPNIGIKKMNDYIGTGIR